MNEHMPAPGAWPFVVAAGVTLVAFGIPTSLVFSLIGLLLMAYGLTGWIRELIE